MSILAEHFHRIRAELVKGMPGLQVQLRDDYEKHYINVAFPKNEPHWIHCSFAIDPYDSSLLVIRDFTITNAPDEVFTRCGVASLLMEKLCTIAQTMELRGMRLATNRYGARVWPLGGFLPSEEDWQYIVKPDQRHKALVLSCKTEEEEHERQRILSEYLNPQSGPAALVSIARSALADRLLPHGSYHLRMFFDQAINTHHFGTFTHLTDEKRAAITQKMQAYLQRHGLGGTVQNI